MSGLIKREQVKKIVVKCEHRRWPKLKNRSFRVVHWTTTVAKCSGVKNVHAQREKNFCCSLSNMQIKLKN